MFVGSYASVTLMVELQQDDYTSKTRESRLFKGNRSIFFLHLCKTAIQERLSGFIGCLGGKFPFLLHVGIYNFQKLQKPTNYFLTQ